MSHIDTISPKTTSEINRLIQGKKLIQERPDLKNHILCVFKSHFCMKTPGRLGYGLLNARMFTEKIFHVDSL